MENGTFEEFKERLKIYVVFLLFMFQVGGGKLQGWGLGITRSLLIGNVLCVPIRSKNSLEVVRDWLWIIEDDVVRKSLELGNLDSSLSWESLWDSGGRGGWTTSMPHGDCFLGAAPLYASLNPICSWKCQKYGLEPWAPEIWVYQLDH